VSVSGSCGSLDPNVPSGLVSTMLQERNTLSGEGSVLFDCRGL
jgi:hypothetical protein